MRTPAIDAALEATISRERLEKYLEDSGGILDAALSLYERNMRIAEAFYTPLQCMEVCFRNSLHSQLSARYGDDWLTNGTPGLAPWAVGKIGDAVRELGEDGDEATPGRVVAKLHFGFWVGTLGPGYDETLWRFALTRAFSDQGRGMKRKRVLGRFNALRRFRNRIAHHEPIFHRNLPQMHAEVIEAIQWMCPETAAWAAHRSRVPEVLANP